MMLIILGIMLYHLLTHTRTHTSHAVSVVGEMCLDLSIFMTMRKAWLGIAKWENLFLLFFWKIKRQKRMRLSRLAQQRATYILVFKESENGKM